MKLIKFNSEDINKDNAWIYITLRLYYGFFKTLFTFTLRIITPKKLNGTYTRIENNKFVRNDDLVRKYYEFDFRVYINKLPYINFRSNNVKV